MPEARILVVDDERAITEGLRAVLQGDGYEVDTAPNGLRAWQQLQEREYGLVLADLRMPGLDGVELLARLRAADRPTEVVIITGAGSVESAVQATKMGAYDYLEKPLQLERLRVVVSRALEAYALKRENRQLEERLANLSRYGELVGASEAMRRVFETIEAVAPTNASVLIVGESGTGKELVARAIHERSHRRDGPFVAINCAAFPREILENELFGHEKGAFTGALQEKPGCFELAHGGTLFLDEVAEMAPDVQVKLLRALEQRSFRRLGGKREIQVDIRVVAATNKDVRTALEKGELREDLYHRLAVIPIVLPPLRERQGDVRLLAEYFLKRFAKENGKAIRGFHEGALEFLHAYRWPGNVRELKNAIERAVILARGPEITLEDLRGPELMAEAVRELRLPIGQITADEAERRLVLHTVALVGGDLTRAARLLGKDVRWLRRRLDEAVRGGATVPEPA